MAKSEMSDVIAERLNWLFDNILNPSGKAYSHQDVEDGTSALGYRVTTSTIWAIRHRKTPNPGVLTLRAIAHFFGVESSLFLRETVDEADLTLIREHAVPEDAALSEIMQRVAALSEGERGVILEMMRLVGPSPAEG